MVTYFNKKDMVSFAEFVFGKEIPKEMLSRWRDVGLTSSMTYESFKEKLSNFDGYDFDENIRFIASMALQGRVHSFDSSVYHHECKVKVTLTNGQFSESIGVSKKYREQSLRYAQGVC